MCFDVNITTDSSQLRLIRLCADVIETPFDLIIGLPTIRRYDLTRELRSLFVERGCGELPVDDRMDILSDKLSKLSMLRREMTLVEESIEERAVLLATPIRAQLNTLIPKEDILGPASQQVIDAFKSTEDPVELIVQLATEGQREESLPEIIGKGQFEDRLRKLVRKYESIFAKTVGLEPAKIKPRRFQINRDSLKEKRKQLSLPPRRQSKEQNKEIRRQVQRMLQLGVIQRPQSSTYSQVLLAPKPGGKWRFCIDYRSINTCMEAMRWPLPRIDHMLQRIGDKKARIRRRNKSYSYTGLEIHKQLLGQSKS
jgi:lambda repressor-like predicted transcriptional regulator